MTPSERARIEIINSINPSVVTIKAMSIPIVVGMIEVLKALGSYHVNRERLLKTLACCITDKPADTAKLMKQELTIVAALAAPDTLRPLLQLVEILEPDCHKGAFRAQLVSAGVKVEQILQTHTEIGHDRAETVKRTLTITPAYLDPFKNTGIIARNPLNAPQVAARYIALRHPAMSVQSTDPNYQTRQAATKSAFDSLLTGVDDAKRNLIMDRYQAEYRRQMIKACETAGISGSEKNKVAGGLEVEIDSMRAGFYAPMLGRPLREAHTSAVNFLAGELQKAGISFTSEQKQALSVIRNEDISATFLVITSNLHTAELGAVDQLVFDEHGIATSSSYPSGVAQGNDGTVTSRYSSDLATLAGKPHISTADNSCVQAAER